MLLGLGAIAVGGYWLFTGQNKPTDIPQPEETQGVSQNDTTKGVAKAEPTKEVKPLKQRLTVETVPTGAFVIVEGTALNKTTPVELNVIPESNKSIDVRRLGYQTKTVDLPKDPTQAGMKVNLAPKPVTLSIKSTPPGAKVFINGSRKPGKTPMDLKLTEATQDQIKMTLKKSGMKDVTVPLAMSNFIEEENDWKGSIELELRPEEKTETPKPKANNNIPKQEPPSVAPTQEAPKETEAPTETAVEPPPTPTTSPSE